MRELSRPLLLRYGTPVLLGILIALQMGLWRAFFVPSAFLLLLSAVVWSAWYGGLGPGLLATALGGFVYAYFGAEPHLSLKMTDPYDQLRLGTFVILAVFLTGLIEALHSARRRAEAMTGLLRGQEEHYRRLVETSQEGIWTVDAAARIQYVNRRGMELLGYPAKAMIGQSLWEFLDSVSRKEAERCWERCQQGQRQQQDWHFRRHDGADLWAQVSITPNLDDAGAFRGALVLVLDVTERQRAEESLRFIVDASQVLASSLEYESTLRSVARLTVPALADWCAVDVLEEGDAIHRLAVVHSDPAKEDLAWEIWRRFPPEHNESDSLFRVLTTGRSELYAELPDELLQTTIQDPERLEMLRRLGLQSAMIVPLRVRGRTLGAITLATAESGRRYGQAALTLAETLARRAALAVDNALLYREAQKELAERTQAEAALRELTEVLRSQQKWLESVLDLMPSPMLFIEPGTARVTFANRATHELAGGEFPMAASAAEYHQVYYCTDAEDKRIPDDQMPGVRAARGERLDKFEMNWRVPDGTRSLLIDAELLPAMHGHPATVVMPFQDITQLKQIEAELRRTNQAKDEFLAMLGHELRNPLAPLLNALHILRLGSDTQGVAEQAWDMAQRQVRHMTRLIDDLLDVSRITRGKIQLRKELTDLGAVVSRAVETSRPLIESRRHELAVKLPQEPVRVQVDTTRLEQIVANLLNNAAKYTEPGGRIWVTAERSGNEAIISVGDTGIGIPTEMLPRIFDMFVQVDRSLDRAQGGLGIGLTLVKSLVEMHGGNVHVRSAGTGQGSEFIVRLPLPRGSEVQAPLPAPAVATANGKSRRVLVVDDNVDAARSLSMLLQAFGHEVCTAHDGQAALETAASFHPQVVLLDIGLPKLDGYEVARRLRCQPGLEKALLVALTGYGQEGDRRRSEEAGMDWHLVKPVDPAELERILAGSLG
jgi:PAS domain S-box-containing protein